ncbi:hypothetical protein BJN34_01550 [Cupriavidus necator]|uniref:TniQ domain-containing protein n=1 Tax=Cupriavidus necator TaxID=106590 RepID=A0A1U9UK75_CUPNE|nr:hypothetical protein BJN34_01550 [Cupriavidus necator]
MYILPVPLLGESAPGYVMRSALVSGLPSLKAASQHFFGRTALQPPLILPGNLALFAQRTCGVTGSLDMVFKQRTVLPALVPFLSTEARERIDAHLMGTSGMRSPYAFLGLATAAGAPKHAHLFCPQCVREGMDSHGWSYWRREHQIPFLLMCPHHGEPLTSGCGVCRYSEPGARHLALPPVDKCWCGSALRPIAQLRTDDLRLPHQRYARLSYELLQGALSDIGTTETIGAAYQHRAVELGFVRNGRVDRQQFYEAFEEHHGMQFLDFHRSSHDTPASWCSNAMAKGVVPPSMVRNTMLIDFLFGTVKALTDTVDSLASTPASGEGRAGPKRSASREINTERLEFCKREVLRFRKRHPRFTRKAILQALGRTAMDLREDAREWYEDNMPASVRPQGRPPRYREQSLRGQAAELMSHILERHRAEMNTSLRPRRITVRLLLSGHSLRTRIKEIRATVPAVDTLIDRLLEDKQTFQHRVVRWFLDHPQRIPIGVDKTDFISRSVGLPASTVARIAAGVRFRRVHEIQ